jgi:hypothetical protein
MVGLSGDRIRQYENNVRKPKPELRQKIINALDVVPAALSDIEITSVNDMMHTFFFMENILGLSIDRINKQYTLTFNNSLSNKAFDFALNSWYTAKQKSFCQETDTAEVAKKKQNAYNKWRYQYSSE